MRDKIVDNNSVTPPGSLSAPSESTAAASTAHSIPEDDIPKVSNYVCKKLDTIDSRKQLARILGKDSTPDQALNRPHKFWDTQPVPKLNSVLSENDFGPFDYPGIKTPEAVRPLPYTLPEQFEWSDCDLRDDEALDEVYNLLQGHYVEDDDNLFRFDYQRDFLRWALLVPNYKLHWHVGVRVKDTRKLVGFITGTPVIISLMDTKISVAEINFLCVHKKLRSKRLAPVLIREITRRANKDDIWQGLYTAGTLLPTPMAQCRYYHRSLNIRKLVECRFSSFSERMTMRRAIRLYALPDNPLMTGFRPMVEGDVPAVFKMLTEHLKNYKLHQVFQSEEDIRHTFIPRANVVYSYVREQENEITDFGSFYSLPSSVISNEKHQHLYAAYAYYMVPRSVTLRELMHDVIIAARNKNFDVFNALDLAENESIMKDLKFGVGDGSLRYYIYNWKVPQFKSKDVNIVLL